MTELPLVKKLISAQFPKWAGFPLYPVPSAGTDNEIFRLGEELAVRLPRYEEAASQIEKEQRWLPKLAPFLPLEIPIPLEKGFPSEDFPWNWGIYRWIEGENAIADRVIDWNHTAVALGRFIAALQKIDPTEGPLGGKHNGFRGVPLQMRDDQTRDAIAALHSVFPVDKLTEAWETALSVPMWKGSPVWLHGDLQSGNLLVKQGQLSAVIDFGLLGIGDPACDAMAAWTFLPTKVRGIFRATLPIDDATWARARGWALSWALIALAYYLHTNLILAGIAKNTIEQVLTDQKNRIV